MTDRFKQVMAELTALRKAVDANRAMLENLTSASEAKPAQVLDLLGNDVGVNGKKGEARRMALVVLKLLNEMTGRRYRPQGKVLGLIAARMKEGATLADFELVIRSRVIAWRGTEFSEYLRPSTLFGGKFGDYLGMATEPDDTRRDYTSLWREPSEPSGAA